MQGTLNTYVDKLSSKISTFWYSNNRNIWKNELKISWIYVVVFPGMRIDYVLFRNLLYLYISGVFVMDFSDVQCDTPFHVYTDSLTHHPIVMPNSNWTILNACILRISHGAPFLQSHEHMTLNIGIKVNSSMIHLLLMVYICTKYEKDPSNWRKITVWFIVHLFGKVMHKLTSHAQLT